MRIVVAMSGGVDSSVAAFLLKEKGYDVIGMTMKTWPEEECGSRGDKLCCSLESVQFARSVAEDLGIPYYVLNLSKEFAGEVTDYFAREYSLGRTPNPCIYCNSRLKFGHLYRKALSVGAEKISTGHYSDILRVEGSYFIAEAKDKKKDQSYFLFDISKEVLPAIEFPLANLTKDEVRDIARKKGFMTSERPESQDICFASAGGDYKEYLLKKIGKDAFREGDIVDTKGKIVGRHKGIVSYTVGQRKGLGVAMGEPVYVIKIDTKDNIIVVGERDQVMRTKARVSGISWHYPAPSRKDRFEVKIRYASKKSPAVVMPESDDSAMIEFDQPQFAPTPGQAAVFYDGEIVAGGGWIEEAF
jgi:tRNA-specific 2-thiouridylase